jgi:hypothetical protein
VDYLDCRNVLMHLNFAGQKRALWHISSVLRPGGHVFLNDCRNSYFTPLLQKHGGWLTHTHLHDLGLRDCTYEFPLPNNLSYLFTKTYE